MPFLYATIFKLNLKRNWHNRIIFQLIEIFVIRENFLFLFR